MNTPPQRPRLWWDLPADALENPEGVRRWLEQVERVRSANPDKPDIQEQAADAKRKGEKYLRLLVGLAKSFGPPPKPGK